MDRRRHATAAVSGRGGRAFPTSPHKIPHVTPGMALSCGNMMTAAAALLQHCDAPRGQEQPPSRLDRERRHADQNARCGVVRAAALQRADELGHQPGPRLPRRPGPGRGPRGPRPLPQRQRHHLRPQQHAPLQHRGERVPGHDRAHLAAPASHAEVRAAMLEWRGTACAGGCAGD